MTRNAFRLVFFLLVSATGAQFSSNTVHEVSAQTPLLEVMPQPNIFFTNVTMDPHPVPNKPFKISANIQSQSINWDSLIVHLTAPEGISVMTPVVANLGFASEGNTVTATWTIMAGSSGSYPLVITAHSNFPLDTESFTVTVNVGTPHSLVVTGLNIPGSIFPNNNFTVSLKLKNAASLTDNNLMAQIYVPAGLQLLDNVTRYIDSIGPNQESEFSWHLRAENSGSYAIHFNFTSSNAGPSSISGGVNVGNALQPTGGLLSITAHPATLMPNAVTPILFDIANSGVQPIRNLQIVSASGGGYVSTNTPIWVGDLGIHATKIIPLNIYTLNDTLSLQIPIMVKYDSNENEFNETYHTELPLGNQPVFKINGVTVTPPLSYAGDIGDKIDIQLFNFGLAANDVYATLKLPSGLAPAWGNSTSLYFGRINTFQTVTASFYVNVDNTLQSGIYPISVLITNGGQQTTLNVNLIVSPKAQFQLVSEDDSQLYPGATNVPFKITMKNAGTATAQTITTTLLAGNSIPGVKSDSITSVGNMENIGTVLPGQTFVTTFMVDLQPQFAAGDQSTTVEIIWSQNSTNTSNAFVQTVVIPYHVANGPYYLLYYDGIPWSSIIIGGFVITGLVIFIVKRRRRLKMMELVSLQHNTTRSLELSDEFVEDISAIKDNRPPRRSKILNKETSNTGGNGEGKSPVKDKEINQM